MKVIFYTMILRNAGGGICYTIDKEFTIECEMDYPPMPGVIYFYDEIEIEPLSIVYDINDNCYTVSMKNCCYKWIYSVEHDRYCESLEEASEVYKKDGWIEK